MKIKEILSEVSRGDYYKKATLNKAGHEMSAGFARSPEEREKHQALAARRERGLARSKARTDKFWAAKNAQDAAEAEARRHANREANMAKLAQLEKEFDPNYQYIDAPSGGEWHKHHAIAQQIAALKHALRETASVGATSAANIGTVVSPHLSPGKARGKKSYTGSMSTGSGTKAPPQPKVNQPKNADGTAKNGLDMKSNIFGSGAVKR